MRRVSLLILSLAGLFDSIYLLWVYTSPSHPLICLGTGCDVVRASRYAHLWGHSMPVYGVAMYVLLVIAVLVGGALASRGARRLADLAVALLSAGGLAFSLYLTSLEAFVIHAWCAWCVGSAIIILLIFLLALGGLIRGSGPPEASRSSLRKQFAVVLVVMVIGGTLAYRYLTGRPEVAPVATVSADTLDQHLVRPDSHATGNLNSPVTVVEFGDFECQACGTSQAAVQRMLDQYGNRIRFVFRQFPLVQVHPYAETAAEASECAAEQGKFWEAERKFYQEQDDLTEPALVRYAADIGLDTGRLEQCLIDGTVKARIQRDLDDGTAVGIQGTPTFFVGHEKYFGPPSFNQLAQMIDSEFAAGRAEGKAAGSPAGPGGAGADTSGGDFGSFGGSSSGTAAFTSPASAALACNPDELKNKQPAVIHTPEAQQLFESNSKPMFIDVRPASQFASGHVAGAVNIPVDQIEPRAGNLPKDGTLVLYEGGKAGSAASDVCAVSRAGARVLLALGFSYDRVKVYQDGLAGWEKAGLPVSP